MTGVSSFSKRTRSPITAESLSFPLNAAHEPSASPGLISTPATEIWRSVGENPIGRHRQFFGPSGPSLRQFLLYPSPVPLELWAMPAELKESGFVHSYA